MSRPIPSLDGIRAVAMTIVFVSHLGLSDIVPGAFGVTLFFFLSGYLITTLLLREHDGTGRIDLAAFYARRFFRLMPPLLFVLGLTYALWSVGVVPGDLNLASALSQILYVFNYFEYFAPPDLVRVPAGTELLWSLAVEEHFYLVFPLLMIGMMPRLPALAQVVVLAGLCLAVLTWRWVLLVPLDAGYLRIYKMTDTRLDSILFGCLLAYLVHHGLVSRVFRAGTAAASGWTGAGLALLLLCFVVRDEVFRSSVRYSLQGLAMMPLFYYAVHRPELWVFRPLNAAAVRYLGVISYTMYLVHHVIIETLVHHLFPGGIGRTDPLGTLAVGGLAFILSLATGAAVLQLIEAPAQRLRDRFRRMPDGRPDPRPSSG